MQPKVYLSGKEMEKVKYKEGREGLSYLFLLKVV